MRAQSKDEQGRALRANVGRDAAVALRADEHRQFVVQPPEIKLVDLLLVASDAGVVRHIVKGDESSHKSLYPASLPKAMTFLCVVMTASSSRGSKVSKRNFSFSLS